MKIEFISAGAGSGKTHRVTEDAQEAMENRTCRPAGLIATTFTVKAANELRERLRTRLYEAGLMNEAERLDEAMIGTVHGVCVRLLGRFAFEAGISPKIEVLAEDHATLLLGQAVEMVCGPSEIQSIQRLAERLSQQNRHDKTYTWKDDLKSIIAQSRANDFSPESLSAMAERSCAELFVHFPPESPDDLDARLTEAIELARQRIHKNRDSTTTTRNYVELLDRCLRDLRRGSLKWSQWVKLSKAMPAKVSQPDMTPVSDTAGKYASHPRFRADIREYVTRLFELAGLALSQYQRLKEERGLVDFGDLEHRTLELLRNSTGSDTVLAGELDLLVVDEFQDTSPIQLALFLELARRAKRIIWVGDMKQAIYGFRGTDPVLIDTVVATLRAQESSSDRLTRSYRAVPDLVKLTNALFTQPFASSLGLEATEVELDSDRESVQSTQPAVGFFQLENPITNRNGTPKKLKRTEVAAAIAEGIARLLGPASARQVLDKTAGRQRAVQPGDIAILCRTNTAVTQVAIALSQRGLPVSIGGAGLLATPEVRLALACLRRLADRRDTLATAEIVALEGKLTPEEWLTSRLNYLESIKGRPGTFDASWGTEAPFEHPAIIALDSASALLDHLAPSEALDHALALGNVFKTVTAWGPDETRGAQRRANLEALRSLVQNYESICRTTHRPASLAGFLYSCEEIAAADADNKASDESSNAIHVSTYHKAKGLEWPVVVCADLDSEARIDLWGLNVVKDEPGLPFSMETPLANRRLRYWPWPFGNERSNIDLATRIQNGPEGQEAARVAGSEALRLLYVGLTRARDHLVLVVEKDQPQAWLEQLNAPWLKAGRRALSLPGGSPLPCSSLTLRPPAPQTAHPAPRNPLWFAPAQSRTVRLAATLTPSAQPALEEARVIQVEEFGGRLPIRGHPNEADLGDALHAVLAAHLIHPDSQERVTVAGRVLNAFGLAATIDSGDAMRMADRFCAEIQTRFNPTSWLVEVPFTSFNEGGQRISGFIDLLLDTAKGWVIIDHKSFPGARDKWESEALGYSGQLACYRAALESVGLPVAGTWIHFAVGGGLVEVWLPSPIIPRRPASNANQSG